MLERIRGAEARGSVGEVEAVLGELEGLTELTESPVERLERAVYPWVAYGILPIFALANSGVAVSAETLGAAFSGTVAVGIALGLLVGKPVGILLFSWLSVVLKLGRRPERVTWNHIAGAGALAGIGFTVSIFIAGLAFDDPALMDEAKIGILTASVLAGLLGYGLLRLMGTPEPRPSGPQAGGERAA
jgi:NhaA family Na+:H+ antiporter